MKVLYHLRYRASRGADRWVAEAWQGGFEYHGHTIGFYSPKDVNAAEIHASGTDLFMTDVCLLNGLSDAAQLRKLRALGTKVSLYVHWPLVSSGAVMDEALRTIDVADLYYGEREPGGMGDFEQATGKRYLCMPNAADHRHHYPADPDPRYAYDIVFLGARLPKKKWLNHLIEKRLVPRYRVGLFGPFWSRTDRTVSFISRAARKLGLIFVAGFIDRLRISIPIELERVLYSSAKICINFHEREADGSLDHNIVNQRLFKIAACDGFQISDAVPGIARNFPQGGIVTLPLDEEIWVSTIDHYLNDTAEREVVRRRVGEYARSHHYAYHRVASLLTALNGEQSVPSTKFCG